MFYKVHPEKCGTCIGVRPVHELRRVCLPYSSYPPWGSDRQNSQIPAEKYPNRSLGRGMALTLLQLDMRLIWSWLIRLAKVAQSLLADNPGSRLERSLIHGDSALTFSYAMAGWNYLIVRAVRCANAY